MPIDPRDIQFYLDYLKSNNVNSNTLGPGGPPADEIRPPHDMSYDQYIEKNGVPYEEFARANGIRLDGEDRPKKWDITDVTGSFESENTPDGGRSDGNRRNSIDMISSYDSGYSPGPLEDDRKPRGRGLWDITDITKTFESEYPTGETDDKNLSTVDKIKKQQGIEDNTNSIETTKGTEELSNAEAFKKLMQNGLPYMSGTGTDLDSGAYDIGRYLGMKKGTKGKGLGIAASIGDFLLGSARGVTSGLGYEKRNQYVEDWYKQQQNKVNYTANSETRNTNNLGGGYGAYGGLSENLPSEGDFNSPPDGKPHSRRYGDKDWIEYWDENGEERSNINLQSRDKKDSRQLARKVNQRIREGVIIDGVDYSQFEKVRPKTFRAEEEKLQAFESGGLFEIQNPEEEQVVTFMYGGKKYQGIISNKDKNMF